MAAGGRRNDNNYFRYLNYLHTDDEDWGFRSTEIGTTNEQVKVDQLCKWEEDGKMYVGGKQFISPQGLQIIQAGIKKTESLFVTDNSLIPVESPALEVKEFPSKTRKTTSTWLNTKEPMLKDDSGLADMGNWSPVEVSSIVSDMDNLSQDVATSGSSIPAIGVNADQCQENNRTMERANTSGQGKVHIEVVINAPINGTINISG
ncbi:hypothetical protein KUTeg_021903 [Tegillarca granosa]|uniref:Uncharacterized protein n=1 Tax=Tegillarca granosa TaxID=220873 RepID=A0ABQ9E4X3_TEGGR|nr:hypothetical protein KUTeg_021903 [Tegillarca granosa]